MKIVELNKNIEVSIDRGSVANGDDPMPCKINADPETSIEQFIVSIINSPFWAWIGGRGCWMIKVDGQAIGVVQQRWTDIKLAFLVDAGTPLLDVFSIDTSRVFFDYWASVDPDLLLACLQFRKKLPNRHSLHRYKPVWYKRMCSAGTIPKPDF